MPENGFQVHFKASTLKLTFGLNRAYIGNCSWSTTFSYEIDFSFLRNSLSNYLNYITSVKTVKDDREAI